MANAVIYARYSSANQRDESIDAQVRECTKYAQRKGLEVIGTYIDRGISAKTDKRPEFLRMMREAQSRRFDFVIVYQLDRFSRNRYDSATYKHKLRQCGVKVLSAMENLSDNPESIILESVLEGYAEFYSVELARKVTRGMMENIYNGKWNGGTVPTGYKVVDHNLVIDEHRAEAIRIIFDMYSKGKSKSSIVRHLNSKHYTTSTGNEFKSSTITNILANEKYIGTLVWKEHRIENALHPIVDKDLFLKVQEMSKNKVERNASDLFILTGKLACPKCGKNMVGTSGTSKNGKVYYYYTCLGKTKHKNCDMTNINRDRLEDTIYDFIIKLLDNDEYIDIIAKQTCEANKRIVEDNARLNMLEVQLEEETKKLNNLMKAIEQGIISETLNDRIAKLEAKISEIRADYDSEALSTKPIEITPEIVKFFFSWMKSEKDCKQKILEAFVNRVEIGNGYIDLYLNYTKKLPILENEHRIECSWIDEMVEHIVAIANTKAIFYPTYYVVRLPIVA